MNYKDAEKFVLSCIDASAYSKDVCDYSAWIAQRTNLPLKLLHTIEHRSQPAVTDYSGAIGLGASEELLNELTLAEQQHSKLLIQQGEVMLKAARHSVIDFGVTEVITRQRHGSLPEALVALESQIHVLVLGLRGESHECDDVGVGAQLESTIRALHKPILVVNGAFTEPHKIMLAYDDSEGAKKALSMISEGPLFHHIPCHIVYVGDDTDHNQAMLRRAAEQLLAVNIETTTAIVQGTAESALTSYQSHNEIDLTVMGAYSHNIVRDFLLGSFTAKMLAKTRKPLLLLR